MGRIPDDVFSLVRIVMERPDFAALEWEPVARRWYVGLLNGHKPEDGHPKLTWYIADRLSKALDAARVAPVAPPAQGVLAAPRSAT